MRFAMKKILSLMLSLSAAAVIFSFISGCDGGGGSGGGGSSAAKEPGFALEPDGPHAGNDCSDGGKTVSGSGMIFACGKNKFPVIKKAEYVPGEVLVKFKEGTSQGKAAAIMNSMGNSGVKTLFTLKGGSNSLLKKVKLKQGIKVVEAVAQYKADPDVEYAEPNYIYRAMAVPDDPGYSLLWGLNNTGQSVNGTTGTSNKDIDAPEAWDKITDCSSVIAAVLDTGINYNHRDLAPNMWDGGGTYPYHGYDYVDNDNNPMDLNGHGTHCAGTIGANGNDTTGLTGVCWKVKLMAVRVLDASGSGTLEAIAQGIDFAVAQGAHVISASLGGPHSATMQTAVNNARTNGVIVVAAAGNEGTTSTTYSYPAAYGTGVYDYDNVISVAAIDQNGNLASFSNRGTSWVDIAAPGVNILSTWPGQHVVTREDFTDWIIETGWGTGTYTYGSGAGSIDIDMLTNPSPFGAGNYQNNLQSMAFQVFDLNAYGAASAAVSFYADINIEEDYDWLVFLYNPSGSRPGLSNPDYFLNAFSGNYGGLGYAGEYDLTLLLNNDISMGFYFESDYSDNYKGSGIGWFDVTRLYLNNTACLYSAGTSMAAPHVTGVVAMAIQRYMDNNSGSYSKTGDYVSIINAVYSGSTIYGGLSTTVAGGKMLNADGAVDAIDAL